LCELGCAILSASLQGGGAIALSGVESSLQAANLHLANNKAQGCARAALRCVLFSFQLRSSSPLNPCVRPLRDDFAQPTGNGGGIWASGSRLVELTGVIYLSANLAEVNQL
jgi:hypothetical protein